MAVHWALCRLPRVRRGQPTCMHCLKKQPHVYWKAVAMQNGRGGSLLLLHSLGIFTFMYLKWWLTVLIKSLLPSKSCSYNTWQHKNQGLPQDTREALLSIHHVFNLIHVNTDGSSVCQRETSSRAADGPRTAAHLSTNPGSWDHTVTSSCLKMIISITSERHRQGKENHMQKCQF